MIPKWHGWTCLKPPAKWSSSSTMPQLLIIIPYSSPLIVLKVPSPATPKDRGCVWHILSCIARWRHFSAAVGYSRTFKGFQQGRQYHLRPGETPNGWPKKARIETTNRMVAMGLCLCYGSILGGETAPVICGWSTSQGQLLSKSCFVMINICRSTTRVGPNDA